ncbi:hypothetical protein [Gracilibacillus alcaliphilus]|uniref:hypothetical protein n=1 Tax=Gracilibacillus alcaliphilus TaxID=1401441 RepID=UPI00195A53C0|nr:hypothetical protein [Gracilibacillus alcaliphilus]MBM7678814.1 hypothetical protein [Gracilibacillus alcaliphilus]
MKGVYIFSVTVMVVLMFIYQWLIIKSTEKKEKMVFSSLILLGWSLAVAYIVFPNMDSPAKIMDYVLKGLRNIFLGIFS